MKNKNALKVFQVWESENKIVKPSSSEVLLDVIDQLASMFSAGPYYYYIINFNTLEIEFVHENVRSILGIKPNEFTVDMLFEIMHPDDLAILHKKEAIACDFLLKELPTEDMMKYKVSYLMRLKNSNGTYSTILHQTKVLNVSEDGKVQQVIGIHTDVTYLKIPFDNKISFIGNKRPSYHYKLSNNDYIIDKSFSDTFTKREKEIIKLVAHGKSPKEIAVILFISQHTVNTHKKNMLKKSGCKNSTELIAKCIREGVV